MCGIAGIYNFRSRAPVEESVLKAMCDRIAYRGPDGAGYFSDGPVGFGHRRLSIIDVNERSNQPMISDDQNVILTYNGEVYNYLEIAKQLEAVGQQFRTKSDTEVLLNLYRHEGLECVHRLNGMYAFAIWDRDDQSLFIVRDRVGIKPVYYTETADGIVFASEVKAILAALPNPPGLHEPVIDSYMSFGYVPGQQTMFAGIKKLPPGHYLTVRDGEIQCKKYWDISFSRGRDLGFEHYQEQTIELLRDATRLQLRSDVPLGVFLSGGVDSSAVVAMMRELQADPIKTFSVRWDSGIEFDESQHARKVSELFDTEYQEYTMTEDDFLSFLPRFQYLMDEPVTEAAAISLYHIAEQASQAVTVILSGEGADEVFGGYPIYRFMRWVERYKRLPRPIRKHVLDRVLPGLHGKLGKYVDMSRQTLPQCYFGVSVYDEATKQSVYTDAMQHLANQHSAAASVSQYYASTHDQDLFSRMQYVDVKTWLVDDLLIKADRMSMAASMELRVPFLDHRFFEFSATIPSKYLAGEFESKRLLKKSLEPYLPKDILYRKKMGFPTPVAGLLRGRLGDMADDLFNSRGFSERGYFDKESIVSKLREHRNGTRDHHKILWQVLVFETWCNAFLD